MLALYVTLLALVRAFPQCLEISATQQPQVEFAGSTFLLISSATQVLQINVCAQHILRGKRVPYQWQPGDQLLAQEINYTGGDVQAGMWIRNAAGEIVGPYILGEDGSNYTREFDQLLGYPLNEAWASDPASYEVVSLTDPLFASPKPGIFVARKAKLRDQGTGSAYFNSGNPAGSGVQSLPIYTVGWTIFVSLGGNSYFSNGHEYTVRFGGSGDGEIQGNFTFFHDDTKSHSNNIYTNQVGYLPQATEKQAFFSLWLGDFGDGFDLGYEIFNCTLRIATSSAILMSNFLTVKLRGDEFDDSIGKNYQRSWVYQCDFSSYAVDHGHEDLKVCIPTLGCSYPFRISDGIYTDVIYLQARSFYYQRIGVPIVDFAPGFDRPPALVPGEMFPNISIYETSVKLSEVGNGEVRVNSGFHPLLTAATWQF